MKRIRIAVVSDILGAEKTGMTAAAANMISYLKARGHEVRVICPDEERRGQPGYYVILPVPPEEKTGLARLFKKETPLFSMQEMAEMKDALEGADVVHIVTPFRLGTLALQTAEALQLPVTADLHFTLEELKDREREETDPVVRDKDYAGLYERFYSHVKTIHYPTTYIRDVFESAVGRTSGKVIFNGVSARFTKTEAERPEEWKDKFVILYTARFTPEKSHDILIEAVRQSEFEPRIQLIFAGEGPLEEELAQTAEILTNPPVMKDFTKSELLRIINCSDLYVHPAEVDTESLSCIEAVNCGLVPVIANAPRSAARFFALGSKNLYQYNDPLELTAKIEYWMTHEEEKEKLSLRYQRFTNDFSLMPCMEKLELMLYQASGRS